MLIIRHPFRMNDLHSVLNMRRNVMSATSMPAGRHDASKRDIEEIGRLGLRPVEYQVLVGSGEVLPVFEAADTHQWRPADHELAAAMTEISNQLASLVMKFDIPAAVLTRALVGRLSELTAGTAASAAMVLSAGALSGFAAVLQRVGSSGSDILEAVSLALERTPSLGSDYLSPDDAKFVVQYGGLDDPESGRGSDDLAELVAEQAAIDEAAFLSTKQVAALLDIDETRVRHRRAAGTLIATKIGKELRFPRWQFASAEPPSRVVPHLRAISDVSDNLHPVDLAARMTTTQPSLRVDGQGVTPAQWLLWGGDVESVIEHLIDEANW